jgi:hypothetical protein
MHRAEGESMKTQTTETVNASVILTFDNGRPVTVAHKSTVSREHVAANIAGHIGRDVTLSDSRFGWTKGRTTWFVRSVV